MQTSEAQEESQGEYPVRRAEITQTSKWGGTEGSVINRKTSSPGRSQPTESLKATMDLVILKICLFLDKGVDSYRYPAGMLGAP